jgi:restriction endonuclease Mrr
MVTTPDELSNAAEETGRKLPNGDEIKILGEVLALLNELDAAARERLLYTASAYFGVSRRGDRPTALSVGGNVGSPAGTFSEDRSISAKDFVMQKQPKTDVERVACLAFYLTHYRDARFFKTLDISKLNTDAAQVKFANAAYAVANAEKAGLLAPAQRGQKQLSAVGEQFVLALPDRDAAKAALANLRKRRRAKKNDQGLTEKTDAEDTTAANGQQAD